MRVVVAAGVLNDFKFTTDMVELLLLHVVNLVYRVPYDPSKRWPYHCGPAA